MDGEEWWPPRRKGRYAFVASVTVALALAFLVSWKVWGLEVAIVVLVAGMAFLNWVQYR